jgi:hypothetical protein
LDCPLSSKGVARWPAPRALLRIARGRPRRPFSSTVCTGAMIFKNRREKFEAPGLGWGWLNSPRDPLHHCPADNPLFPFVKRLTTRLCERTRPLTSFASLSTVGGGQARLSSMPNAIRTAVTYAHDLTDQEYPPRNCPSRPGMGFRQEFPECRKERSPAPDPVSGRQ